MKAVYILVALSMCLLLSVHVSSAATTTTTDPATAATTTAAPGAGGDNGAAAVKFSAYAVSIVSTFVAVARLW